MQPYQSYLSPGMQPYSNPYLNGTYGQQMGYQQPQQQINPLLQSPQQQPQGIPAVIVDDFSKILAKDVPMDNQGAFFIKSDGTEAEWRVWDASGQIKPTHYKAILDTKDSQTDKSTIDTEKLKFDLSEEVKTAFMKRFDDVFQRLDELEGMIAKPPARKRGKDDE